MSKQLLVILLAGFTLTSAAFSAVSVGNAYWRLSLTAEDDGAHSAGSLTQLYESSYGNKDWCTGSYFLTPRLFGSTLEDCSAYTTLGVIHFTSESMRSSTGESIPLQTELTYTLQGPVIHVRYKFTATATVDQQHAIESYSEFAYTSVDGYTNGINDFTYNVQDHSDYQSADTFLNQVYIFHSNVSDLAIISPDPYYSFGITVRLPGFQNRLQLQFLISEGPYYGLGGEQYHSVLQPGTVVEREFFIVAAPPQSTLADIQHPLVYFSPHPSKADRSVIFMWDEVPIPNPYFFGWLYSYDENGDNVILNGLISLMNNHPKSRMTLLTVPDGIYGGMPQFNEGDYYGWAGYHSADRFKNYAPADYIAWLQDIANHNPAYPWMTRTDLGSHGYHHTQSPQELNEHEFEITGYDRAEALFHAIHDDLNYTGLSADHIQAGIRFPGFQYVQDALRAGAKWGIRFYDNYKEFMHFRLTHQIFPEGEIWGVNTCWWADYSDELPDYGRPFADIQYILDRGKIALLGGHPIASFVPDQPGSYARMEAAMQLIDQYPNLEWVWPVEIADRIERITGTHNFVFNHTAEGYEFSYNGGLGTDDTLIVDSIPSSIVAAITIDSMPIADYEYRNGRLYISHCPMGAGEHTVRIPTYTFTPSLSSITLKVYPNPSPGIIKFNALGSRINAVKVKIYTLDGTCVDDGSNWTWTVPSPSTWLAQRDLTKLASGVYLYVADCTTFQGKQQLTGKFAILR
jgi:hypothetical protein